MPDKVGEIFRRAKQGMKLFANREFLSPEYVPDQLPFREDQINAVAEVLAPILHGSKPSNLLLYGKTGTGKTAVTKNVLKRLENEADARDLVVVYVNTRTTNTEYRALAEFAKPLNLPEDRRIPSTGLATGEVVDRIFTQVKTHRLHVVLVMDEIDYLVKTFGDGVLYDITRSGERTTPGFISLVGISNDLTFKESLDPRVLSSLSEEELVFPPYTVDELREILKDRAEAAFRKSAVTAPAINLCAAIAGSEHGDARRAVDLLRIAGEVADREGQTQVDDVCVKKASEKIERDEVDEAIRGLPVQNKAILLAASKFESGTNTGELYLVYNNLCKKLGIEALTQRRMSGILAELDMMGLIKAAVTSKGRRGRTKRIQLLVGDDALAKGLSTDPEFAALVGP